jgi:hypothetical protein
MHLDSYENYRSSNNSEYDYLTKLSAYIANRICCMLKIYYT